MKECKSHNAIIANGSLSSSFNEWLSNRLASLVMKIVPLVDFVEIFEFITGIRNDGIGAWLPACRTNFAVLIRVLERLHQTQRFVDRSSDREIIHGNLPQGPLSINDEEASQSVTGIFEIHAVIFGDLVRQIGEQRNIERTQTAVLPRRLDPSQMSELGIYGDAHDFGVDGAEFIGPIAESDDFRGTNEGEIQRIEEENEIFSLVHIEIEILEFSVDDCRALPVRRRFGNERFADGQRVGSFGCFAWINQTFAEGMTGFFLATRQSHGQQQQNGGRQASNRHLRPWIY